MRSKDDQFKLDIPLFQLQGMSYKDEVFTLQELSLQNFQLQTTDADPDVSIPMIHLAGLKIQGDDFELAELTVDSNFISLKLEEAQPQRIHNQLVPYSQRIHTVVSPNIHTFVRQEFDVSIELAAVDSQVLGRLTAFDGALELVELPDESSFLALQSFSPAQFFNFESGLIPERCSLMSHSKSDGSLADSPPGECFLGPTRFVIPEELAVAEEEDIFNAIAQVGKLKITAHIKAPDQEWPPIVGFSSEPPAPLPDILSQIYFNQNYQKLIGGQRSRIDALVTELEKQ